MKGIGYYCKKFIGRWENIMDSKRIKQYGLGLSLLEMAEFLGHRKYDSKIYHFVVRRKDLLVKKYIEKNYSDVLKTYKDKK